MPGGGFVAGMAAGLALLLVVTGVLGRLFRSLTPSLSQGRTVLAGVRSCRLSSGHCSLPSRAPPWKPTPSSPPA